MDRYTGKNVVVIGGTQGMGLETARMLCAGGARVIATGRNSAHLEGASRFLQRRGRAVRSDVSQLVDIESLAGLVKTEFGAVDAVFIFAAIAEFSPFDLVDEESFDRQFAVNTRGAFFAMQRLAPLVHDGGSITAVTVTPAPASPGMGVYMGTKGAVRAFTQVLAAELVTRNVRVNCFAPGFVDTPSMGVAGLTPQERAELSEAGNLATPMKRHGTVEEMARAAIFLAFDATFTTGVELVADGGLSTIESPSA